METTGWLARLPHRDPFRFITEVLEIEAGNRSTCVWKVRGDEDFFRGHFPDEPIVPGVLLTEALAQASGLALLAHDRPDTAAIPRARLARIDIKIHTGITPPTTIRLLTTVTKRLQGLASFDVRAEVDRAAGMAPVVAASGSIVLAITDDLSAQDRKESPR